MKNKYIIFMLVIAYLSMATEEGQNEIDQSGNGLRYQGQYSDAILADYYGEEEDSMSYEEQAKILEKFDNQKPIGKLPDLCPKVKFTTVKILERSLKSYEESNKE